MSFRAWNRGPGQPGPGVFGVLLSVLLLAAGTPSGARAQQPPQHPSGGTNTAFGHTGDDTEGIDAFADILGIGFSEVTSGPQRNLDLGGGRGEENTLFLARHGIENAVYDPYHRSREHNQRVLAAGPYDSVTSMSVLNVISTAQARQAHVELAWTMLKPGGKAWFKIWRGDGTGRPRAGQDTWQANRPAQSFAGEVTRVFGPFHVVLRKDLNLIVARKYGRPAGRRPARR